MVGGGAGGVAKLGNELPDDPHHRLAQAPRQIIGE
jgi:hypothetical protein